jgi:alpha-tubulin suppressor-like RCC1 family protein
MKRILLLILAPIASLIGQNLQISGGNNFSAAVCDNQIVYAWGSNANGQLGIDATGTPYGVATSSTPIPVGKGILPQIRQIDAGSGAHILGLDCNKQVWAWGENGCGQIGKGGAVSGSCGTTTTVPSAVPTRVLRGAQAAKIDATNDPTGIYLHDIFYVSGGNNSSYAIEQTTGRVFAWGQNTSGQLGNGNTTNSSSPVLVLKQDGSALTGIIQIEGGDKCAYALDNLGNVWSWGVNAGAELGRTAATGTIAAYRAGQVEIDANFDGTPDGVLSGITQISGGDTHGLGLAGDGSVWSWGGDWGPGQRGLGPGYQGYTGLVAAYKVLAPNLTTATDQTYKTGPYLTGATYVAAGQASSAVVLSTGEVVTFGAQGFFTGNSGDGFACPDPDETAKPQYALQSGALGNCGQANGACASFSHNDASVSSANGYSLPTYVMRNGTTRLNNIVSVSDGDAWYFAVDRNGDAFAWGWNRRGELGTGNTTDAACAISFPLPTDCEFTYDCPGQPKLPANYQTCPIFSDVLDSQIPKTYPSYVYTWYTRPVAGGTWSLISGATNPTYTANVIGQYKVVVSDNRGPVSFLCAPCPSLADSVIISERPNPYTSTACYDHVGNKGKFDITGPAGSKIKWYTALTGGTALNPADSNITITTASATLVAACGAGKYGLFAEDLASKLGTLIPGTTQAAAQTAIGCSTMENTYDNSGDRFLTRITVTQSVKITAASFIHNANSGNASIKIYNNTATNTVGTLRYTSPTVAVSGAGPTVYEIPMTVTLPAGSYWIATMSAGELRRFNCNFGAAIGDNLAPDVMTAVAGMADNSSGGKGTVFNIKFETGTGYTCGRVLVCEASTCVLPVSYIYFNAIKVGKNVNLSWSTANEDNTKAFAIYRSFDNVNFVKVGEKSAKFNGHSYNDYDYTDHLEQSAGNAYYRIVEIDIFGANSNESNTASVNLGGYNSSVSIAPNPNAGSFRVSLERESDLIDIKVVDLAGKQILSQVGAGNSVNVNLGGAHKGVYLIYIFDGTDKWVEKIVVE